MEKLLDLLKQYWKRTFNDETLLRIYYEEKTDCFCWMYQPRPGMKLEQGQMLETPVVFSNRFGFIKWLVDNDKINKWKLYDDEYKIKIQLDGTTYWELWWADRLLMLLAIQDEPIKYLYDMIK